VREFDRAYWAILRLNNEKRRTLVLDTENAFATPASASPNDFARLIPH
jgi:hypothetical protein